MYIFLRFSVYGQAITKMFGLHDIRQKPWEHFSKSARTTIRMSPIFGGPQQPRLYFKFLLILITTVEPRVG
jgi:hypothetical protein